jgi:hypothetical protein
MAIVYQEWPAAGIRSARHNLGKSSACEISLQNKPRRSDGKQKYRSILSSVSLLDLGLVFNGRPRPLDHQEKDRMPVVQGGGWAPGPVWVAAQNLFHTGIRSTDRPTRSKSYRIHFPNPQEDFFFPCMLPFCFFWSNYSRLFSVTYCSFRAL